MSFGSSAYGGAAHGGSANSANEQIILPYINRSPGQIYEGVAFFSGPEEWYEVLTRQATEEIPVEYKIYSANGPGETPQLQTTVGGGGPTQSIISARPIIVVRVEIQDVIGNDFEVKGRPYTQ